ncbi:MAG TPA: hypothetical protein VMI54_14795 [Polyangiaceae bacterium]|nr:hypothetical protein [Polyangiaceae bacterium]
MFLACVALAGAFGCTSETKKSAALAKESVQSLVGVAKEDVREIRSGLPLGAAELAKLLPAEGDIDPQAAREALETTRNKVQDLRIAKSTFFALATPQGIVIRDDQQQDRLAGKNLMPAFPGIAMSTLLGQLVETRGSLPEAAEVRGRPDAEWVAAIGVGPRGSARAMYLTGWSWSAYAYRLENAARTAARSAATNPAKEPLLYAFVIVDDEVYGAPVSPDVNLKAVHDHVKVGQLNPGVAFSTELEITGRGFGLAAELAPDLGTKVAIAVLRSET